MQRPPRELARTSALALTLELLAIVAAFVALSVVAGDPKTACRWCAVNPFDTGLRAWIVAADPRPPAAVSHWLSMGVAPLLAVLVAVVPAVRAKVPRHGLQDFLITVNALLLTIAVTDFTKKVASRERPGFHFGRGAMTEAAEIPVERFLSFFSGDTSSAFALVVAAATLAHLRGRSIAPGVAVVGGLVGTAVATLRVAADMHWPTDVLTGALVGTAVASALPRLVHPAQNA